MDGGRSHGLSRGGGHVHWRRSFCWPNWWLLERVTSTRVVPTHTSIWIQRKRHLYGIGWGHVVANYPFSDHFVLKISICASIPLEAALMATTADGVERESGKSAVEWRIFYFSPIHIGLSGNLTGLLGNGGYPKHWESLELPLAKNSGSPSFVTMAKCGQIVIDGALRGSCRGGKLNSEVTYHCVCF